MSKINLIAAREYTTRVRKKSFIIMSILGPILFSLSMVVPIWLATQEGDVKVVEVVDESGMFEGKFNETESLKFRYIDSALDMAKEDLKTGDFYGLLYIPAIALEQPEGIKFYVEKNPSLEVISSIEANVNKEIERIRLLEKGIDPQALEAAKSRVNIESINLAQGEEKSVSTWAPTAVGYISAFLIYFFIFYYGIMTMRGVIEEKANRIVEVVISSVRPMQLMMGKIVGIGGVGLTQFLIWVVLSFGLYVVIVSVFGLGGDPSMANNVATTEAMQSASDNGLSSEITKALDSVNFLQIGLLFLFYFLGAYLLYGSLFAAIGSAVDSDQEAQQFQFPVTLPLLVAIVMITAVIKEPHGPVAFWLSVIPFTSPVIMMMRLPFDPSLWELVLSMLALVGGFVFTTWLAARIYRVGILMHGSKVNYKTLARWFTIKY
jgi:ABC-2 type transport system permease protein